MAFGTTEQSPIDELELILLEGETPKDFLYRNLCPRTKITEEVLMAQMKELRERYGIHQTDRVGLVIMLRRIYAKHNKPANEKLFRDLLPPTISADKTEPDKLLTETEKALQKAILEAKTSEDLEIEGLKDKLNLSLSQLNLCLARLRKHYGVGQIDYLGHCELIRAIWKSIDKPIDDLLLTKIRYKKGKQIDITAVEIILADEKPEQLKYELLSEKLGLTPLKTRALITTLKKKYNVHGRGDKLLRKLAAVIKTKASNEVARISNTPLPSHVNNIPDTNEHRGNDNNDHLIYPSPARLEIPTAIIGSHVTEHSENGNGHSIEGHGALLKESLGEFDFACFVGKSEPMLKLYKTISLAAPTNASILLIGETGTGKEVAARAIHMNSLRAQKAFISVNCAALAQELQESELFGHERGSFTGANGQKKGYFEVAHEGTIFLDEIGDMPLSAQAKLLRVLQEREVTRVGSTTPIKVDVRVIAATNHDLDKMVKEKIFREDLFYRLKVIDISIPPLKERRDDIPLLMSHFLAKCAKDSNLPMPIINEKEMRSLKEREWKGNVRELRNLCEKMVILNECATL